MRRRAALVLATVAVTVTGSAAGAEDPVRIDAGPSGLTRDARPTFAFTIADGAGGAECRLDDAPFSPCASPHVAPPLADGPHVFEVRVGDARAFRTFTVDTVAPVIDLAEELRSGEPVAAVSFAVDDGGADVGCAVDDGPPAPCGSPFRTPPLRNGSHTVRVRAADAAGNVGEAGARLAIDAGDVDTAISGPEGPTNDEAPEFGLTASRDGSRFECSLDGAAWAECGSTYVAPQLGAGEHVLRARAIDPAGNVDPTPAERAFEVTSCETRVPEFGVIDARAECFRVEDGTYIADGPVRMNGITFNPVAGRSLRFNPERRSISLGPIQLRVGPLVLYQGELAWTVPEGDEVVLARIDLETHTMTDGPAVPDTEAALDLEGDDGANAWGLEMKGEVVLSLTKGRTQLRGTVELPRVLKDAEGRGLTGEIVVSADNDHGIQLDSVMVTAPTARVGDIELHNLWVMFAGRNANVATPTCNEESPGLRWEGGADVVRMPTAPEQLELRDVGFGFADGRFNHAEAHLERDDEGLPIAGGVRVQKAAISLCAGPPLRAEGRISLTALPDEDGRPRLTVPDAGVLFQGGDPWSLRAEVPKAQLDLGVPMRFSDLSLSYTSTGAIAFHGQLELSLGTRLRGTGDHLAVSLATRVDGFIEGSRFNARFGAHACFHGQITVGVPVPLPGVCTEVDAVVSSAGIAICGDLVLPGVAQLVRVGIGHSWGGPVELMGDGCDVTEWHVIASSAGAAASTAGRSITLPGNARGVLVAVRGVAGPPRVVLRGPRGEVVRASGDARPGERALGLAGRDGRTTYIALGRPAGGRWIVEPEPGSVIERIATARVRRAPSVSATVRGRGRNRVLRYRVARARGQVVTFVERGRGVARTIAQVRGGRGQRRFRVADGPAGRRKLIALVEQDGLPREQRTVAAFTAPGPARPGMPRGLRASGGRRGLRLRWRPAPGAARYGVRIALSDGRRLFFVRGRGERHLRFAAVRRARIARVRVVALSASDRHGRASTAAIRLRRSNDAR
jgi:hypothetical protein